MNPFAAKMKSSPEIRPRLNVSSFIDVQTGSHFRGKYGEMILNGGVPHITTVCGRGNMFKTVFMLYLFLSVLDRYIQSNGSIYDTEMSLTLRRLQALARGMLNSLLGQDFYQLDRVHLTDKTVYDGTKWFELLKEVAGLRYKMEKGTYGETPFIDHNGKNISFLYPLLSAIDSFSMFAAANIMTIQDLNGIGEGSRNTEAMRDAASKTQFLMELPTFTANNGLQMMFTAHMGDAITIDQYDPPAKKLAFLKKVRFKNVPEKVTFLANDIWYIYASELLTHKDSKEPFYPRDDVDRVEGSTDLMKLSIMNLRGKSGPTGMPFEVAVSQRDGVQADLTNFLTIKENNRFGLTGDNTNYGLALYPSAKLSRTKIRGKLEEDRKLARALEITADLCAMTNGESDVPRNLLCTPQQLFDDIKAKGYDWDELYETRSWWEYDNYKSPIHQCSTHDLLNIRAGTYKPYWKQ